MQGDDDIMRRDEFATLRFVKAMALNVQLLKTLALFLDAFE